MAYSKQNFQNGQILNAANLEAMENGIIAGQGAYNLLDNSDFTNPVNSQGKTSYTGAGDTIDRWKAGVSDCSMYVNAGQSVAFNTKTEGVNAYWRQYLPHSLSQLKGKTFTLAIKDTWGKTHCASGVYPSSAPSDTKSVIWINMYDNISIVLYCAKDGTAFVQLSTKKSVPVVWVALYEGSYTADTLPLYVPKGKHIEMLNCGVSLAPHNLLDNSDFANPVNQRGVTSVVDNWKFIVDRWVCTNVSSDAPISVNTNGITLNNAAGTQTQGFRQYISIKDGAYTVAAKTDSSIWIRTFTYSNKTITNISSSFDGKGQIYVAVSGDNIYIAIQAFAGYSIKVNWAALYEGAYDASTLPAYRPKGYAAELAECQRYYIIGRRYRPSVATFVDSTQNLMIFDVQLPQRMRIKPTATIKKFPSYIRINGQQYSFTDLVISATYYDKDENTIGIVLKCTSNFDSFMTGHFDEIAIEFSSEM